MAQLDRPSTQRETTMKSRKVIGVLILLNLIVLLGQLWPEGAPPFARVVNIVFLVAALAFFVNEIRS